MPRNCRRAAEEAAESYKAQNYRATKHKTTKLQSYESSKGKEEAAVICSARPACPSFAPKRANSKSIPRNTELLKISIKGRLTKGR